jgi:membrane associated rhomboid family serine protease
MYKISITYLLIWISFFATLTAKFYQELYNFWLNSIFFEQWEYWIYILQLFLSVFLHWWITHFLMNSIFLYFFWTPLELLIWKKKYITFFLFIVFFNWILLTAFNGQVTTIWISGFCMAILSYYVLELKSRNNAEYKWWITAITLNIAIWFLPETEISLLWHLFWAIWWVIFYFLNKDFFSPKLVWKVLEKTRSKGIVSEN